MSNTEHSISPSSTLNAKWQERFAFFDQYGGPQAPDFKAALKALPSNKRRLIAMNIIAFFFGPVYLFVLGMWRKNLSFLAIVVGIGMFESIIELTLDIDIPRGLDMGVNIAMAMMYGMSTNYGYYLKQVKGSKSWNPFEGMRWV
jgi:hypothetical protein